MCDDIGKFHEENEEVLFNFLHSHLELMRKVSDSDDLCDMARGSMGLFLSDIAGKMQKMIVIYFALLESKGRKDLAESFDKRAEEELLEIAEALGFRKEMAEGEGIVPRNWWKEFMDDYGQTDVS